MTVDAMRVGVTATRAPWSVVFRGFVRDHASGIVIEPLLEASQLPGPGRRALDVLIVDDQMVIFAAAQIVAVQAQGTHVIGLWDESAGRGRDYLVALGVSEVLPVEVTPAELVGAVLAVGPVNASSAPATDTVAASRPGWDPGHFLTATPAGMGGRWSSGAAPRARVTAFMEVTGGAGCTEAVVAVAERLSRSGSRVLVVEAVGTVLAHRLRRAPEYGLLWSLERVRQGQRALPEGLSPGREDGVRPLGGFDVICGTSSTSSPPVVSPMHLGALLDEAVICYDDILIEMGPLAGPPGGRDRFGAAWVVVARADQMVVFAAADPCGAVKLIEWQAGAADAGWAARSCAVFGRAPAGRFERGQLADNLEASTVVPGFASIHFLPEDRAVARARWNAEMVVGGRWLDAVTALATVLAGVAPREARSGPLPSGRDFSPGRQHLGATR